MSKRIFVTKNAKKLLFPNAGYAALLGLVVIVIFCSLYGLWSHLRYYQVANQNNLRLVVAGPSRVVAGEPASLAIKLSSVTGKPLNQQVKVEFTGEKGEKVAETVELSNGQKKLRFPEKLFKEAGVVAISVTGGRKMDDAGNGEIVAKRRVRVVEKLARTHLTLEKTTLEPGETLQWQSRTLDQYSLQSVAGFPLRLALVAPVKDQPSETKEKEEGKITVLKESQVTDKEGTLKGIWQIPSDAKEGIYSLVAVPVNERPANVASVSFLVQRKKVEDPEEETKEKDEKYSVAFFPIDNKIFFSVQNALGCPVVIEYNVTNGEQLLVANQKTTQAGRGSFYLNRYVEGIHKNTQLNLNLPNGKVFAHRIPGNTSGQKVELRCGSIFFRQDVNPEFLLRTNIADLPLYATLTSRGNPVAAARIVTEKNPKNPDEVQEYSIKLELPASVSGALLLTVFDYSTNPPKQIAARWLFRAPSSELVKRLGGATESLVVDKAPQPKPDEQSSKEPSTKPKQLVSLTTSEWLAHSQPDAASYYLLACGNRSEMVPSIIEYVDNERLTPEQEEKLSLYLGTRPTLEEPSPFLFDNLHNIRKNYLTAVNQLQNERSGWTKAFLILGFFGSLGGALLVLCFGFMRVFGPGNVPFPCLGLLFCAFLIGWILLNPQKQLERSLEQVPIAQNELLPSIEAPFAEDLAPPLTGSFTQDELKKKVLAGGEI